MKMLNIRELIRHYTEEVPYEDWNTNAIMAAEYENKDAMEELIEQVKAVMDA